MLTHPQTGQSGTMLLLSLGMIVLAFMSLSLAITATGTARFATAMGYPEHVGYLVGGVFDLAKAIVPVALLVLLSRRAYASFVVVGAAWIGLAVYSALATHATVGLAVSTIERTATWQMETRSDARAELETIEQRLEALSKPRPPRPAKTVSEALARERVPAGVWRKSGECQRIRQSRYFQKACAHVLDLRAELAAAQDYERLNRRAQDLRKVLAGSPIVATSDPLPQSFASTIGRFVPVEGRVGIALLLTIVTEIFSCFGLAALRALHPRGALPSGAAADHLPPRQHRDLPRSSKRAPYPDPALPSSQVVPLPDRVGNSLPHQPAGRDSSKPACSVGSLAQGRPKGAAVRAKREGSAKSQLAAVKSNVSEFVRARLRPSKGQSVAASDLLKAYEEWCMARGETPLSQQKLGAELRLLNLTKWKSCGRIRYRDVQLLA